MSMQNLKNKISATGSEIFTVWSDEVENRLDPFFYRPVFKQLVATINGSKRKAVALADLVEFSAAGEWGENPDDFDPNPEYQLCYVLRNTNFDNQYNLNFDDVAKRYIKNHKVEKLTLRENEILIEKSGGSPIQPVGRVALVEKLPFDKPVLFSNFLQKIRIANADFLPEYVFTYLQAIYHLGYTEFLQNQTTGIKNLRLDDFFKIKVVQLPKNEQKKIADFASNARKEAKRLEQEANRMIASIDGYVLGELGVGVLGGATQTQLQTFTVWSDEIRNRIDPIYIRNTTLLKEFKSKYTVVKLAEVLKRPPQYGANTPATEGQSDRDIRYIRITDIDPLGNLRDDGWKTAEKVEEKYLLHNDDLLFARSGATAGKTFLYKTRHGKAMFAGYMIRMELDRKKIEPEYVFSFTRTSWYELWVKTIQRPSGQPNINAEEFGSLEIPLPPLPVQRKIVDGVRAMYGKIDSLHREAKATIAKVQQETAEMILA